MAHDVAKLLPHKDPFILIDELKHVDDDVAFAQVRITADSAFCEGGSVPNYVGIEYIAQTIGLFSGYHDQGAGEAGIGFLLSVRDCEFFCDSFHTGQDLNVEVKVDLIEGALATFVGSIWWNSKLLVTAKVTTIRPEPDELAAIKEEAWNRAKGY